jgi:hypothetical protein
MPTHSPNDPVNVPAPQPGYEASDVSASGIAVFLAALMAFVVVFFIFCYGMGKVINNQLVERDGPPNKWNTVQSPSGEVPKAMASNPAMEQQQLQQLTQRFPTPRLQTDDGNQELADMHIRESLLLDNYSWIDRGQGRVRIPIDRAMMLIAQRGLPVLANPGSPQVGIPNYGETPEGAPMEANGSDVVIPVAPLTNGFAPTGYEQELAVSRKTPEVAEKQP